MLTDVPDESTVRRILENLELKIILDSPDSDYRFEYFTTSTKDRQTGESKLTRTYRLVDLKRGGVTPEPYDTFDLDKQTRLVTNLVNVSRYRMKKVIRGWEVNCPACGQVMRGKNWESTPKICSNESPKKCGAKIVNEHVVELLSADP